MSIDIKRFVRCPYCKFGQWCEHAFDSDYDDQDHTYIWWCEKCSKPLVLIWKMVVEASPRAIQGFGNAPKRRR